MEKEIELISELYLILISCLVKFILLRTNIKFRAIFY